MTKRQRKNCKHPNTPHIQNRLHVLSSCRRSHFSKQVYLVTTFLALNCAVVAVSCVSITRHCSAAAALAPNFQPDIGENTNATWSTWSKKQWNCASHGNKIWLLKKRIQTINIKVTLGLTYWDKNLWQSSRLQEGQTATFIGVTVTPRKVSLVQLAWKQSPSNWC